MAGDIGVDLCKNALVQQFTASSRCGDFDFSKLIVLLRRRDEWQGECRLAVRRLPVRIIWSEIAQATFVRFMADQAGMMAVNRAVEALADDPAPLGAFVRGAYR